MARRRTGPIVLGLDLSLTSPAAVAIRPDWRIGVWSELATLNLKPEVPTNEKEKAARIRFIVEQMLSFACRQGVGAAFVEDYAFSRQSSSVTKLAELGGHARVGFDAAGLTLTPVPASAARRVLLTAVPRKGAKRAVEQALILHGAGDVLRNDDLCDAFAVANWGRTEVGLTACVLA